MNVSKVMLGPGFFSTEYKEKIYSGVFGMTIFDESDNGYSLDLFIPGEKSLLTQEMSKVNWRESGAILDMSFGGYERYKVEVANFLLPRLEVAAKNLDDLGRVELREVEDKLHDQLEKPTLPRE